MMIKRLLRKSVAVSMLLALTCCALIPQVVFAQGDLKPNEVITVTDFNAVVAEAVKINFPAEVPARASSGKMELVYETPVQPLTTPFAPTPLKPIAIGKEKPEKLPMNYFKVGFGTQLSPLFEALWNDGRYEKFSYGAFFRHFSSRGMKIKHQNFNTNQLSVFANYFTKKARINSEINFDRNVVLYYGYDHDSLSYKRKEVRQHFNDLVWTTSVTNTKNLKEFNYKANFDLGFYGDRFDRNEFYFRGVVQMDKIFRKKHFVTLKLVEDISIFNSKNEADVAFSVPLKRNILSVKPVYEFNDKTWRIFGGMDLTWENKTFHFFPELGLERSLWDQYIVLYNGWRMELNKTSFKSLTDENPWLGDQFEIRNTWFEDRYIGLKGTVKDFSYNLRFAQRLARRMPLFINDTTDMKYFEVVYDVKTNILNFQAELFYHINKDWNTSLTFEFYHYEMDEIAEPWHLPNFKIDFNTQYNIKKKVYLTLDLFVRDGVQALNENKEVIMLKSTADINLGATYKFSKHFSFFCNLNNIASIKYQKYYLYPSYGFNGMIGAIFTY